MNRPRSIALCVLGFALQAGPAAAWWQLYGLNIPWYGPPPGLWYPSVNPSTWAYQTQTFGPNALWSTTSPMGGLFVEREETPLGLLIRIRTGESGVPAIDLGVQGGVLTIARRSLTTGWTFQWLTLPADAAVERIRVQRGNGVVEVMVPRRG